MSTVQIEQLSALLLLIDFVFGITFSAGARVSFGIYLRGYQHDVRSGSGRPADGAYGKGANR